MLRVQGHGGGQVLHPPLLGLARQAVDQVQGQIFDLGLSGGLHRLPHLLRCVDPADGLQFLIAGGLHPQGDAVEPRPPQGPEGLPVSGRIRVGLKGDLRVLSHMVPLFDDLQDFAQPLFPQIAGGAAAEIHGVHRVGGRQGGRLRQMDAEGVGISVHAALAAGQGVKIAVNAFSFTEGNMDIQPQGPKGLHSTAS